MTTATAKTTACAVCGVEFAGRSKLALYCGSDCASKAAYQAKLADARAKKLAASDDSGWTSHGITRSGYSESRPAPDARPVEVMPCCRRRPADGHGPECANYTGPVKVQGPSLAEWAEAERRRKAEAAAVVVVAEPPKRYRAEPEPDTINCEHCGTSMPPGTRGQVRRFCSRLCVQRAYAAKLRQEKLASLSHPCTGCGETVNSSREYCTGKCRMRHKTQLAAQAEEALTERTCVACNVTQPIEQFWVLRNGRRRQQCADCMTWLIQAGAKRRQPSEAPPEPASGPMLADEGGDRVIVHPVENDGPPEAPSASTTLANLRDERERCVAYLAELDERIATAEAIEQFAGLTPDELAAMLAEAKRQAELLQMALQARAAA